MEINNELYHKIYDCTRNDLEYNWWYIIEEWKNYYKYPVEILSNSFEDDDEYIQEYIDEGILFIEIPEFDFFDIPSYIDEDELWEQCLSTLTEKFTEVYTKFGFEVVKTNRAGIVFKVN